MKITEGSADGSTDAIVLRAMHGDKRALAQAFQRFRPRLKQSVSMRMDRRLCGRVDPSEVVQETFLDASERLDHFTSEPQRMPLFLWLRLLAAQRLIDLHRQHLGAQMRDASLEVSLDRPESLQTSSIWLAEQLVDRHGTGSDAAIRSEIQRQVQEALNQMDALDSEVLAMRHFELLTNQEVALALAISVTASSNRCIRALRRLKDILGPDDRVSL